MNCITGKIGYVTRELAEEALFQNHCRNYYPAGKGPINVYQCDECGEYHFTSKGEINAILASPESKKRINENQEAHHWEKKWKGR